MIHGFFNKKGHSFRQGRNDGQKVFKPTVVATVVEETIIPEEPVVIEEPKKKNTRKKAEVEIESIESEE